MNRFKLATDLIIYAVYFVAGLVTVVMSLAVLALAMPLGPYDSLVPFTVEVAGLLAGISAAVHAAAGAVRTLLAHTQTGPAHQCDPADIPTDSTAELDRLRVIVSRLAAAGPPLDLASGRARCRLCGATTRLRATTEHLGDPPLLTDWAGIDRVADWHYPECAWALARSENDPSEVAR